eukprot:2473309-Rhodomonas_salina.1
MSRTASCPLFRSLLSQLALHSIGATALCAALVYYFKGHTPSSPCLSASCARVSQYPRWHSPDTQNRTLHI